MFGYIKQVFKEFGRDKAGLLSSAFAYTAVFSIGPLLLVMVSIVGLVYGEKAASGQLSSQLSSTVGADTAKTLQNLIAHTHNTGKGVTGLVFGTILLLLGASAITSQLQNSFNIILRAQADPAAGIKFTIYTKFKNIFVVILAGIVALASVIASAIITGGGSGAGWEALNLVASFLIFIVILYMIYRFLPDIRVPRGLVLKTAVFVGVMFLIGKFILGFIIGRNGTAGAYGAAASVIVLLLWFYYVAQILLLGAEGIKVYALAHDIPLPAKRLAVKKRSLDVIAKNDLRGKLLTAFSRGFGKSYRK